MTDIIVGMLALTLIWAGSGLLAYGLWCLSANDPGDWLDFRAAVAAGPLMFFIWWIDWLWSGGFTT